MEENIVPSISKEPGGNRLMHSSQEESIPVDPYANVRRALSEEELTSPAVQRLLLSDHDRVERECERLKSFEDEYHKCDKRVAVLEEKLKTSTASEILYTCCVSIGSVLAGVSSIYWNNRGWLLLCIGIALVIGSVIYKLVEK